VYRDEGESAKTADRDGLKAAVLAARGCAVFVVHKLDRLSRNTADGLAIRAELRKMGCELVSATEPSGSDPVGEMVSTILLSVGQFDNQLRGLRCKRGMVEQAKRGGWVWRAPVGYRNVPDSNPPSLEPDPDTAPAITKALRSFAVGATTKGECIAALKLAGIIPETASRILRQPAYGGLVRSVLTGGVDVRGVWDGLIAPDEWYQLEARMNAGATPRRYTMLNADFPLSNIVYCGVCGRPVSGSNSRGRLGHQYGYYACPDKHTRARADKLHRAVDDMVQGSATLVQLLREVIVKAHALAGQQIGAVSRERHIAQRKLNDAEAKSVKLTNGWLAGVVDDATYQTTQARLRGEVATHRQTAEATDQDVAAGMAHLEQLAQRFKNPSNLFRALDTAAQKRFLTILFGKMTLGVDKTISNPHKDGLINRLQGANAPDLTWWSMSDGYPTLVRDIVALNALLVAA
jgi:DNA invertase Pin-like site-specific DNA recombinase